MKTPTLRYLLLLGTTMAAFVAVEYFRPKPIDWKPTYSNRDAIPYGTKATYELLPGLFGGQPVRAVRLPAYNHLRETALPPKSSYVFVNEDFSIDKNDLAQLLKYVARGNQVFIAASRLARPLEDTLGVHAAVSPDLGSDSASLNFSNPRLRVRPDYRYRRNWANFYFKPDSVPRRGWLRAIALGQNNRGQVNFLKIPVGKGAVFLHAVPVVFTNFYVLRSPTDSYAFKALSYLPVGPVFWDEYQKQGRVGEQSLFRFLLSNPPLRWAYYLTLAAIFLYVLVESRRRQRAIPVVEPPRNTSLEFVETIGQLYFQRGNHHDLAEKKVAHWLAFVRQQYNLPTQEFDEPFRQRLASKSGLPRAEVDALLAQVEGLQASTAFSEAQLLEINRRIEGFYQTA